MVKENGFAWSIKAIQGENGLHDLQDMKPPICLERKRELFQTFFFNKI